MARTDYSHHVSKHRSPSVRVLFVALGLIAFAIGIAGVFIPLLPTTPFMLLAAACFARASNRFYNWLLNTRAFGPTILEWREHRSIPYRIKLAAIAAMALTLTASIVLAVEPPWLQATLAACGVVLGIWLYRIPSRDTRAGARDASSPDPDSPG
ncbi:MAG: YbaN family protein [Burkholderiales bacterium]|nr:YbaN family protein [Burkholderiales bacterium]